MTISTRLRGFRTRFIAEPTISPETFFQALGHVRRAARDEIERLIAWLDSTIDVDEDSAVDDGPCDGDPDSEPSLGSFDRMSDQIKAWQRAYGNFSEIDCELDECDDEPSFGAVEAAGVRGGQEHWAQGAGADQEGDAHEDDEEGYDREEDPADGPLQVNEDGDGNPDDEPLLGWTE